MGNTTNMLSHLQYYHPDHLIEKAANANAGVNAILKVKIPFSSLRDASITKSIAGFNSNDFRPYNMTKNSVFCQMLQPLVPRYEIPSRKYVTEKASPALYDEMRGGRCPLVYY